MQSITEKDIERNQNTIEKYCKQFGCEELYNNLCQTDFFYAPASTKYHDNYEGGLAYHSLKVFDKLVTLLSLYGIDKYDEGTAFKLAICHDLCKIWVYQVEKKWKKVDEKWKEEYVFVFKDNYPYGHGEKSVQLAGSMGVDLTMEECMAIRWHMGAFDQAVKGGFNISNVWENYPLALYLHIADMLATYVK